MLAILGLFGLALSAAMFTGHDLEDTEATDPDAPEGDLLEAGSQKDVVSMDELLGDSASGFTDLSGDDIILSSGNADDTIITGAGNDLIDGEEGNDSIDAGAGDDEVHGGLGDDELRGNDGNDGLFGHVGDDLIFGEAGSDDLNGGDGNDLLNGGDGDDSLLGSLGNDTLIGGDGADVLFGGSGDDVLDGRDDSVMDFVNGGAGNDLLIAGHGDHLNGGDGADRFATEVDTSAFVDDFNIDDDTIEIAYDGSGAAPVLSYFDTDEGAVLMADDTAVATFAGLTSLDLSNVPVVMTAI